MKFTIYQESRVGKRPNNQDRIAYCYSRDALLMVVADGMGGHYHGEVASQIAVQTLTGAFQREAQPALDDPFLFLQKSLTNAHHAIRDYTRDHQLKESPRTTCVACLIQDNVAYWAHCGDSRLYLIRGGQIVAKTRDHSRVRLLLDEGLINEPQAATHPDGNKVYSCLGGDNLPEIEFSRKTPMEAGDVLALCTDGVWGAVSDDLIRDKLYNTDLMVSAPALLGLAELQGGPHGDNLSLVTARWEDSYSPETSMSSISTQTMPLDMVATRFGEMAKDANEKSDLTDAEIEKAIAEIRSAIQKYPK